jgi:hypothetical protein
VDGNPIKLTSHEYRLLALSDAPHRARRVAHELVEHLYDQDFDRDSNTIEVFVGRIRKKLDWDVIQTVRGSAISSRPHRCALIRLRFAFFCPRPLRGRHSPHHRLCVVVALPAGGGARIRSSTSGSTCALSLLTWRRGGERRQASRNRWPSRCSSCRCRAGTGRSPARRASRGALVALAVGRRPAASRRARCCRRRRRRAPGLRAGPEDQRCACSSAPIDLGDEAAI